MSQNLRPAAYRARSLFGVGVVALAAAMAFTPVVPSAGAVDPTPAPSDSPAPSIDPTPSSSPDPSPVPSADPTPTPTPDPTPEPSATPEVSPSPSATPVPTPGAARGTLEVSTSAPATGRRRIDPGAILHVRLSAVVEDATKEARFVADIPPGWDLVGGGGAASGPSDGSVTWDVGSLEAGGRAEVAFGLRAPGSGRTRLTATHSVLQARLEHAGGTVAAGAATLFVAPRIVAAHATMGRITEPGVEPPYEPADAQLSDVVAFDRFRIRFQVRNADVVATSFLPTLVYRRVGASEWAALSNDEYAFGQPFRPYVEWRPKQGEAGTEQAAPVEIIPSGQLRERDTDASSQQPIAGRRQMGGPQEPFALEGDTYTEIEFTISATIDVAYGVSYELTLADGGVPVEGATIAAVMTAAEEPSDPSPGQRQGIPVGPPVDAAPVPVSEVDFPLVVPAVIIGIWPESEATPRYRLAIAVPEVNGAQTDSYAGSFTSPHVPDTSLESDVCATCHRAHTGESTSLLTEPAPQATMCFTCHDGNGSGLDTKAQYTDPAVPANDATTRSYYRHDATAVPAAPDAHVLATDDEFGGVSNRHSACADCHNSHNATASVSVQTTSGWTTPGQVASVSGVAVTNGAEPGSAPTYAFLSGGFGSAPDREYQLCLKCHSGFTTLPSNADLMTATTPAYPAYSKYTLDKGVEFNPSNASFHPVEAAGTNPNTTIMNDNLSGTSPFKQWNFTSTSTIRCVNCHGDPRKFNTTLPTVGGAATLAGDDMAPHTSQYRGLLMQNYRDRDLRVASEPYAAADFALCYMCHSDDPFNTNGSTQTYFRYHRLHTRSIPNRGTPGTIIDQPGIGNGNAICSECHFRIHSTALRTGTQGAFPRLVNFAPNVTGTIRFRQKSATLTGSCTLTCHGVSHTNAPY